MEWTRRRFRLGTTIQYAPAEMPTALEASAAVCHYLNTIIPTVHPGYFDWQTYHDKLGAVIIDLFWDKDAPEGPAMAWTVFRYRENHATLGLKALTDKLDSIGLPSPHRELVRAPKNDGYFLFYNPDGVYDMEYFTSIESDEVDHANVTQTVNTPNGTIEIAVSIKETATANFDSGKILIEYKDASGNWHSLGFLDEESDRVLTHRELRITAVRGTLQDVAGVAADDLYLIVNCGVGRYVAS